MTRDPTPHWSRGAALKASATIICRHVPNASELAMLLVDAGSIKLADAIRARLAAPPCEIDAKPRPNAGHWASQADRVVAGGGR